MSSAAYSRYPAPQVNAVTPGTGAAPAAAPGSGVTVSTHGWDTAYVIPVPDVNSAIVSQKSSPPSFSYEDDDASLSGNFGDWQICQGGDGKNIRMSIPISDAVLTYKASGKKVNFTSVAAIVEIELEFLPHTGDLSAFFPEDAPAPSNPMALKPKTTSNDPTAPVMSVVEFTCTPNPGIIGSSVAQATFQEWGNANLAVFDHVFSVVDLNRQVDQGQWGFVTPNYTGYACLSADTLEESLFSVLTMTGDRTGDNLNEQVAYNGIPQGSEAGFLVSQTRTLQDLVRPAIMQAFSGLTDENFTLSPDLETLYLTPGTSVDLKPVQHNGSTYYPKLKNLTVQAVGSVITLQSYTETEIVSGITAECTSTHWYTVTLGTSNNGQTLVFSETQPPNIVHSIHQSEGSHITQLIIDIVAGVALVILTIVTDGAALVVGGLLIGLLLGADQIVPALIEKVNKDDSPDVSLLQVNAVDPITWPDSKAFDLTYAGLNMSLQMGGTPFPGASDSKNPEL